MSNDYRERFRQRVKVQMYNKTVRQWYKKYPRVLADRMAARLAKYLGI